MKTNFSILIGSSLLGAVMLMTAPAEAANFSFGCDPNIDSANCSGDESGTLDLQVTDLGNSEFLYKVSIDNTSSNNATVNGFGFDFTPNFNINSLVNGSVKAEIWDGSAFTESVFTRGNRSGQSTWSIGTNSNSNSGSSYTGISLNFIDLVGDTSGNSGAVGNLRNGYDAIVSFKLTENLTASGALLRMQTTANDGEGSLKLICQDSGGCIEDPKEPPEVQNVPEPGTAAAMGLLALGAIAAKKQKKS